MLSDYWGEKILNRDHSELLTDAELFEHCVLKNNMVKFHEG